MPVEEIIRELSEQKEIIANAQKRQDELLRSLVSAKDSDWDLVTVQKAALKSGLSVQTIYRFIKAGKIKRVYKGARMYISIKELENLDDKYEG